MNPLEILAWVIATPFLLVAALFAIMAAAMLAFAFLPMILALWIPIPMAVIVTIVWLCIILGGAG